MIIRVFEAFAGYGSQMMALRRDSRRHADGADFQLVGWSEIDNDAIAAHVAIHVYEDCLIQLKVGMDSEPFAYLLESIFCKIKEVLEKEEKMILKKAFKLWQQTK